MHLFECKWIWLKSRTTTHNLHKSDLGPLFFESNAESSGLWIGTLWGPKSNIMVIHQNISFDPHRNGWSTSAASRQNNTGLTNITQIYPLTKGCICLNSISFLCSGSTKITQQGWDMVFIWFSSINWFNQVQENVVYLSFRGEQGCMLWIDVCRGFKISADEMTAIRNQSHSAASWRKTQQKKVKLELSDKESSFLKRWTTIFINTAVHTFFIVTQLFSDR